MTKSEKSEDWLDRLLTENFIYIYDNGFTDKLLIKINQKKNQRLKIELSIWLIAGFGFIGYIYDGTFNAQFSFIEAFIKTPIQDIEMSSYGLVSFIVLTIVSFVCIKSEI